ncbi:uncharacterized protein [Epargyreus clarus]|uniref:uncharacterized protein n=1 Tax=Epargyreus clarus TaxID=520877 RepID=UPI003C2E0CBE
MTNKSICKDSTEINNTCSDFPTLLQETIRDIARDEGYINYILNKKTSTNEGNFIGVLYEADIIGETAEGEKETSLFIKKSITFDKITLGSVPELYAREVFIYNDLSSVFSRLQQEANVPEQERYKVLKSYKCNNEMIIMENLAKRGYKTYHRTQVVSKKFAELSIKELAKFHALSFVIKEKIPRYFEGKIRTIKSPYNLTSDWRGLIYKVCDVTAKVLTGEVKTKIENYAPRLCHLFKNFLQVVIPTTGCLCHGDYKMINILVKEVDGEASEVIPIDYQLLYYGCPVDDLLFFLFTGTDQEFRQKHLNYLKELYFETFAKFLKYFNMDVNSTYSRDKFEADYKERFELGLVFGIYLSVFTFAHIEEGFDVTKKSLSELPVIPDQMFADRVRGIVYDYTEWGYLMSDKNICTISTEVIVSCSDIPILLQETIKNIVKDERYINYILKKKTFSTDGNFMGLLYEVDIVGETAQGAKETSLFIKKSITLAKITLTSVPDLYSREAFVYNDLSRVFSRLQDEANVPEHDRFKVLKSYKCNEEMIITENVARQGFKTYHRLQLVSKKFAELSVIELAKFHALSFVVKEKIPKYFNDKIRTIKSPYNINSDWRSLINKVCAVTAKVLTGEIKTKIENYGPRLCHLYKKYLQDVVPKYGCVAHGDYKMINILVKEVDGDASEVIPIDYQLLYYGCPVDDLLFFLFTGTDQEFRRKHLNYLKELYYETFAKFLKYFNIDVNSSYPREDFEADYKERFELGLVFGIYLSVFTFARVEEGFDVTKKSLSELPVIPDQMFADRVSGIVHDYTEWGYL